MRFKKGDVVKRIAGYHSGMQIGDIDVVSGLTKLGNLTLTKYGTGHSQDSFARARDETMQKLKEKMLG